MDYEKKYNEALNWMRELYPGLHGATKEDAEHYFPELRGSEDERIRKAIIRSIEEDSSVYEQEVSKEQMLAWLEKQKEPTKEELYAEAGTTEKEYIANTMKMVRAMREKKQEQKPAETPSNLDELLDSYFEKLQVPDHQIIFEDTYRKIATDFYELGRNSKPVAWSEVELEFRGEKVTVKRPFFRDDKGRGYSTTKQDEEVAWNALRAWCEKKGISLYDLYPKAEWSEEDADILNCCISSIEEAKENRYAYKETDGDTSYDHEIAWLKSLRPSWKPNDNQMSMLRAIVNDPNNVGAESCRLAMQSLYNDLLKLK